MQRFLGVTPLLCLTLLAGCKNLTGSDSSCSGPTSYTPGATISATLGVNDCKSSTGRTGQLYTLTLSQQTNMALTVTNASFTPLIGLYTSAGKVIAENIEPTLKAFLPAGTYHVLVTNTDGNAGPFTLSSPTATLSGCTSTLGAISNAEIGFVVKGVAMSGTIAATDCGALNAKTHWYQMYLVAGDTLTASATVDHAAGIYLIDAAGGTVVDQELTNAGTWNRVYIASTDGYYAVHVEARGVAASGNLPLHYTLSLK